MENSMTAEDANTSTNTTEISSPVIPPKRRILPFVLIALLLIAAGGGGYWYWTTTPQYSINRISSSIKQHDLSTFKKYVDIESVTGRAVSQLMESIVNDPNAVHNDFEGFAQGLVETLKPQLVKIITNQLESYIETGEVKSEKDNELEGFSLQQIGKKAGGNSASVTGTSYVKKEGKIAVVGLEINLPEYKTSIVVDLKMRDRGNYWQLAEISNLGQLITKLNQLEQTKLAELNRPIEKKLNQVILFNGTDTYTRSDDWGFNQYLDFYFNTSVNGEETISKIQTVFWIKDTTDGSLLLKENPVFEGDYEPGCSGTLTWTKEVNPFLDADKRLWDAPGDELEIGIKPISITYKSGKEIKLLTELPEE